MVFVTIKHSNEKNKNNKKSDAAYLKPMRAGDGNLKISLPWPYARIYFRLPKDCQ